jgi:hypothetical protein
MRRRDDWDLDESPAGIMMIMIMMPANHTTLRSSCELGLFFFSDIMIFSLSDETLVLLFALTSCTNNPPSQAIRPQWPRVLARRRRPGGLRVGLGLCHGELDLKPA